MRRLHGLLHVSSNAPSSSPRVDLALVAVLAFAVLALAFRLAEPRWGSPEAPRYVFDEKYTAFSAEVLARGEADLFVPGARRIAYLARRVDGLAPGGRVEWSHPPGAPLAMAGSVLLFGYSERAVRGVSVLAAMVALLATAGMAGRKRAWLACAFLALDPLFFVFGRTAMPYMLLTALVAAGAAVALRAARSSGPRGRALWVLSGLLLGLAMAVRWTALPVAVAIVASALGSARRARHGAALSLGLVALSSLIAYGATFVPLLASGQ